MIHYSFVLFNLYPPRQAMKNRVLFIKLQPELRAKTLIHRDSDVFGDYLKRAALTFLSLLTTPVSPLLQ